jgi:hypothetical protein
MIKHIQIDTGDHTGSCFSTCIASILEIPVESVPNFVLVKDRDMFVAADEWLRENHQLRFIHFEMYGPRHMPVKPVTNQVIYNRLAYNNPDELVILSGKSPRKTKDRKTKYHAVVAKWKQGGWGFDVVHDPHPSGKGIHGKPYGVTWMVKI